MGNCLNRRRKLVWAIYLHLTGKQKDMNIFLRWFVCLFVCIYCPSFTKWFQSEPQKCIFKKLHNNVQLELAPQNCRYPLKPKAWVKRCILTNHQKSWQWWWTTWVLPQRSPSLTLPPLEPQWVASLETGPHLLLQIPEQGWCEMRCSFRYYATWEEIFPSAFFSVYLTLRSDFRL